LGYDTTDELFVDGALLPLHLLQHPNNNHHDIPGPDSTEPEPLNSQTNPEPEISLPSKGGGMYGLGWALAQVRFYQYLFISFM